MLVGPHGSGKTHLANVWQLASNAARIPAREITGGASGELAAANPAGITVEDIDRETVDERALFHLLNLAREQKFHVLLTARTPPGSWSIDLPDLRSRVRSFPVATIDPPDDALLGALLVKLFADRQLPATPAAVRHLARHMERSMACALALVERIDDRVWVERREVTRDLARLVLAELSLSPVDGEG
ncbi:MAG: chromosomal replication initiator DnaA [Pseudomonadota bacterium]